MAELPKQTEIRLGPVDRQIGEPPGPGATREGGGETTAREVTPLTLDWVEDHCL